MLKKKINLFEKAIEPKRNIDASHQQFCLNFLKSSLADAITGTIFRQVVESRFCLIRNLNILLFFLLARREHLRITDHEDPFTYIQMTLLPHATDLLKTYYALYWMIRQHVVPSQSPDTSVM